jgi:hypothetical protein
MRTDRTPGSTDAEVNDYVHVLVFGCRPTVFQFGDPMTDAGRRDFASPARVSLADSFDDEINGAWWPYSSSIARELPDLIEALHGTLGEIVDIGVSWSAIDGVPDLDAHTRRGASTLPGMTTRAQRVLTMTGTTAQAKLLVVPSGTSPALATMVLRHAAALPIKLAHQQTAACVAAGNIVDAARVECAQRTRGAKSAPAAAD